MKAWLFAVAFALLVQDAKPQEESGVEAGVKKVSAERMKKILTHLASDELEGRHAGYAGNDKATEYIAEHFKAIGLKPCGDKNDKGEATYWQAFEFGGRTKLKTRNCVGLFEGADDKLKEEIVVIGAHHDHVGKGGDATNAGRMRNGKADPEDTIWNGADDNGSGTTTLLEVARAFMEGRIATQRSVLFMTFSAEEYGLLGSVHYCKKPLFPLDKTVAMINMDMVGRNPEKKMDVGGVGTAEGWKDLVDGAMKGLDLKYRTSDMVSPGSDHHSFAQKKVPAVHLFTGFHDDYHCQSDHVEKISFENMEKIGKFALRLVVAVADRDGRMEFKGAGGGGRVAARRLGVTGDDITEAEAEELKLAAEQGGVKLTSVEADSAAGRRARRAARADPQGARGQGRAGRRPARRRAPGAQSAVGKIAPSATLRA